MFAAGGGRGRPLDDAWEHAKPLDEPRQKTQCNYCGFVSAYGGISRLKAHLGGGSTEMQLQGCPNVSLEVKRVMEQWFNEWIKYSMATWTRKSHGKPLQIPCGGGIRLFFSFLFFLLQLGLSRGGVGFEPRA